MIKQNLINERQDVEDIEEALNSLRKKIDIVQSLIDDCRDDGELDIKIISAIKNSYKEALKKILQKVDLESKYYELTLDERIK